MNALEGENKNERLDDATPRRNSPSSSVCYQHHDDTDIQSLPDIRHNMSSSESQADDERQVGYSITDEESDNTPRSEVPSMPDLKGSSADMHSAWSERDYFALRPRRRFRDYPSSATTSTESSPTQSLNASTVSVNTLHDKQRSIPSAISVDRHERPTVQRDLSNTSTTSNATVRVPSYYLRSSHFPTNDSKDLPSFPNQSHAALQNQIHPTTYNSQSARSKSSHASHYGSNTARSVATLNNPYETARHIMDTGSRTAGNSPASSPGLFSPDASPTAPTGVDGQDEHGFYSSPYLHFTHRQAPKETHVADVDVDPISGRKIINQYEVIDELGRGVHGKVKLGRNLESGRYVAIKIVDRYSKRRRLGKNSSHEDKIKREIAILKKARHPNIVSLLEVIDDPQKKKVYIVLEHVELGEVRWRTEGTPEICLVEYRRYQRESRGFVDDETAIIEDERIIRNARKRRQRDEHRQRLRHLQMRQSGNTEAWSLEYASDPDEDNEFSETSSRLSTATINSEKLRAMIQNSSPQSQDTSTEDKSAETETVESPTEGSAMDHHVSPSLPEKDDLVSSPTGLEGTMYGAYESETPRYRTPSLTSSFSSLRHGMRDENVVPEHFRHVPLMTLSAARAAFRDTVLGLEYLHYQGVVHRDIKPANLLQTRDHRIKISDFGVSYLGRPGGENNEDQSESEAPGEDEEVELAKTVGTPAFYAPELCQIDPDVDTGRVGKEIDVWALGVTLYCLVFGRVPFHDNNTFVLMRMIAEDDVFIPRHRLKAVDEHSNSRPSSHGRAFQPMSSSKRSKYDLEYEDIDEDLYDLLKRLLIKDQRKRIKLIEVKHHPWVVRDIADTSAWIDETDPLAQTQGKKIKISPEEVANAVVGLNLVDRVRSGISKLSRAISGIGKGSGTRKRAKSSATDNGLSSTASSSSTISQDARRPSRIDESLFPAALRASREPEHPLSQSVTASPEAKDKPQFFIGPSSRPSSPALPVDPRKRRSIVSTPMRPILPERAQSTLSTAGSVKTIRQKDINANLMESSPAFYQGLPSTPLAVDTPGGSNLGGIFGGAGRKIMNSVRSRERSASACKDTARTPSIDPQGSYDGHAEPSIAVSNALAAGHVDPPELLKQSSSSSDMSHKSSHSPFVAAADMLHPHDDIPVSRHSSLSSSSSKPRRSILQAEQYQYSPGFYGHIGESQDSLDVRFNRAKDELLRKRAREEDHSRPSTATSQRPESAPIPALCPPSPDDEVFRRKQLKAHRPKTSDTYQPNETFLMESPWIDVKGIVTSSSEDQFYSGTSQSTSNPSIPSIFSANSPIKTPEEKIMPSDKVVAKHSSDETLNPANHFHDDHAYDGDHPDEDTDSDEEDFLIMARHRSDVQGLSRSRSVSNAQVARRRETVSSITKTHRSDSNGTLKKIRSHSDSEEKGYRKSIDSPQAE
ncbi:kinase-like protein [Patellaria atrata CBS 101060]|uniref:non-specific serine/threonine protein kinase n=1 Tax=Patellaria atrata CBS 101060 TaxID=1346257 RepID=A0A9P4VR64_9PEZI|nr:kinase-like protein [Patellaria atrata CBS 101060]